MSGHSLLLTIFLASAVLIGTIFYYIYSTSLKPKNDTNGVKNPTQKRFFFFAILAFVVIVLLTITIPKSPYFIFANETPSKVVYVAARQFSFAMSYKAIDPKGEIEDVPIELNVGDLVEFRVTSLDVNHGFGVYNDKAELLTQTQAMPGYVNRLRWKFTEPGTYHILCLEYCGAAHSLMRTQFTVK